MDWLKFIGLSFFSDKVAKSAVKRNYFNVALGFILTLVFMFCGLIAADILPFKTHYSSADRFRQFLYNAFSDGPNAVPLTVSDGNIVTDKLVDTFGEDGDAAVYVVNGYNLIIDTRPADAFDDFNAYCVLKDGTKIDYDDFKNRDDAENLNYTFEIEYTKNELILTPELTEKHERYLESLTDDEKISLQYKEIKNSQTLSKEEYERAVYKLYVKAYYPDLKKYESSGSAPMLRNYYYNNYVKNGTQNYFILFGDTYTGAFKTNSGLNVQFYGYFAKCADGTVTPTAKGVDNFILNAFDGTVGMSVYMYLMNIIRFIPYIALMPLILALLLFCITRLIKSDCCKGFGAGLKITGSFMWFSALIAGFCTFICGYFTPRNLLFTVALILQFGVLAVRTAEFLIREGIYVKKAPPAAENSVPETAEVNNDTVRG